jgi:hypothetical protein
MDELIESTGVSYRALAMPFFMENLLSQAGAIKSQGMFFLPSSGDRTLATVATRDIAAVAARLLLDDSWSSRAGLRSPPWPPLPKPSSARSRPVGNCVPPSTWATRSWRTGIR